MLWNSSIYKLPKLIQIKITASGFFWKKKEICTKLVPKCSNTSIFYILMHFKRKHLQIKKNHFVENFVSLFHKSKIKKEIWLKNIGLKTDLNFLKENFVVKIWFLYKI